MMSKIFGLVTAAAMLASVTAFAQTEAPAPAMAGDAGASTTSDTGAAKHHHHHHAVKSAENKSSDMSADQLNACMADANPTAAQEHCLRQAEKSPS
jgi:hypothetical protein